MTSSNSTSTTDETPETPSESKKHTSRAALYSDDARLAIIQEIHRRPFLWNNESKEATSVSPTVRKQAFGEIATQVSIHTENNVLKSEDVERQWKNLKDTYVKIRKKLPVLDNGTLPRWRFFRVLQFLDQDEKVTRAFDFNKELAAVQNEQRKLENSKSSNSSTSANTSPVNLQFNNHFLLPNGIQRSSPNLVATHTLIPQPLAPNQPINRLKRTPDTQLTYIRHHPIPNHLLPNQTTPNHEEPTSHSSKEHRSAPNVNGALSNGLNVHEDEYVAFCSLLVFPLREIGNRNKPEYLKLQKIIQDAIHESRMNSTMKNGDTK